MVRGGILIVSDFTKPELAFFREHCNFVNEEKILFELRASGHSLEECCGIMGMELSGLKKISKKVNSKMISVTNVVNMQNWIKENYA